MLEWREVLLGYGLLRLMDCVGIALATAHAAKMPLLITAMSTQPTVMVSCARYAPLVMFCLIGEARLLLAYPVHYRAGSKIANDISSLDPDSRRVRLLARCSELSDTKLYLLVFAFAASPLSAMAVIWVAGALQVSKLKLALVAAVGVGVKLTSICLAAQVCDPVDMAKSCLDIVL
jgi:hypothetical protein